MEDKDTGSTGTGAAQRPTAPESASAGPQTNSQAVAASTTSTAPSSERQASQPGGQSAAVNAPAQQQKEINSDQQDEDLDQIPQQQPFKWERVSDMKTFEEKQKLLKQFWEAPWGEIQDGDFIDAVDTVQKWCLAQVVARDETAVRVHFDGWSNKYDQAFRWTSYKLAPFRRLSRGYTGQIRTPLRQSMVFSIEQVRADKERVQAIIDTDFQEMTAKDVTQYLRGGLFVMVDFLLGANTYTEEELVEVTDFFKTVLRLIVAWLNKVPTLLEKCLPQLRKDSDIFLVDEDCALVQCVSELMGLLWRFFCGCHRSLRYYILYDQQPDFTTSKVCPAFENVDFVARRTQDADYELDAVRERVNTRAEDLVYGQALSLLNYFAELGGFESLLALLRAGNTRSPEPTEAEAKNKDTKAPEPKDLMTLDYIGELTTPFLNCGRLMKKEFAAEFVEEVQQILSERFTGMRDKEIKELDKDALSTLLNQFRLFLAISKDEKEISELVEQLQLSFATTFLKTTYLEKRLKGISDLRILIERIEAREIRDQVQQRAADYGQNRPLLTHVLGPERQKIRPTQYLSKEILKDWIAKEKIAELIFGEGAHPEIVKRAAPVLRFLSVENALSMEMIDQVWSCQEGKHEETVRVVYTLINEIVDDLAPSLLEALFKKITEVPDAQYTAMYLQFLKDFTTKALESSERARRVAAAQKNDKLEEDDESRATKSQAIEFQVFSELNKALADPETVGVVAGSRLYGLPVLWNIVQDSCQIGSEPPSHELFQLALDSLCEILSQPSARSVRMLYLLKAMNNLKMGNCFVPSVRVIMSVINGLDQQQADGIGMDSIQHAQLSSQKAVEVLEGQVGFVQLVLNAINLYDAHVKESLKDLARKSKEIPGQVQDHVFHGRAGHQATLEKLLELIEFIVLTSDWAVTLKTANIDILWQAFVSSPNFTSEQVLFLQFINKKRSRIQKMTDSDGFPKQSAVEAFLFTPVEQKHLFTQILCNNTKVNYTKITTGLAKCFQTYFRLINKDEGYLRVRRRKIEIRDFEQLIGLDSLWSISFDCENEKARDDARELLVDIHLKLGSKYDLEAKQNIMKAFVARSMQLLAGIDVAGQSADLKCLCVIQVLQEFLRRYEGKRQVRQEMKFMANAYSHFQQFNLTIIYRKEGNQQYETRLPVSQFDVFGAVRERCANLFNLDMNEFLLKLRTCIADPDEYDDTYIKDIDFSMGHQLIVVPNPAYSKQGHPKHLLAENQEYFEQLFTLLSRGSPSLVEPVWELLQQLPVNQKLHQDIKELRGAQDGWDSLLDSKSTHKLLYSLKIIEGLELGTGEAAKKGNNNNQGPEGNKNLEWKQNFIKLGGFTHLLSTLIGLKLEAVDSKLTLRCIESVLAALIDFTSVEESLQGEIYEKREAVVLTCLKYIHMIGLFTLKVEENRGEAVEDIQAKKTQKRLAKMKLKELQMGGNTGGARGGFANRGGDDDSDGEEDATTVQIGQVLAEFAAVRAVIEKLFNFMNFYIFTKNLQNFSIVESFPDLEQLIQISILKSENWHVRQEAGGRLKEILVGSSGEPTLQASRTKILRAFVITAQSEATKQTRRCDQYYDSVRRTIEELKVDDMVDLKDELLVLAQSLSADIQSRKIIESNTKSEDKVLVGMMKTLTAILQKYPACRGSIGASLVPYLLHDCLFEIPHGSGTGVEHLSPPKCKSNQSRGAALKLLAQFSRDCLPNLRNALSYIRNFSKQASWRTNKTNDWQITHLDDEKSSSGYAGLKNLGCICYMISLFQQLFHVPGFRADILEVDDPNHDNQPSDENMFYQLQGIFLGLLKTEKQYVNPKGFCHAFKDWEGQPTNVLEQMDAEEFLGLFMDRLETAIKGTPQEKTVQSHFGAKFASEMICKGCPHQYERSEPYLTIGIPVKNKRNIHEGLKAFVEGDMLEGDNAYLCAKCDKKVDTLKRTSIKTLPRFLIITLKRFEFDFDRMIRVKVDDLCEFPLELDMLPYTQEGLQRTAKAAQRKQDAIDKGEEIPEDLDSEPLKHPRDYYEFKLQGIVVHTGTAESGHYYSFIKESNNAKGERWYEFNDHVVRDFNIADLASECFGGEENFIGQNMMQMKSQKWRNAYIVLYERKNQVYVPPDEDGEANAPAKAKEESQLPDDEDAQAKVVKLSDESHPIQMRIRLENQKYWQNKFLFGKEYADFVEEVAHFWDMGKMVPLTVLNRNDDSHITGFPQRKSQDPNSQQDSMVTPIDEVLDLRQVHADQLDLVADASHEVFKFTAQFYLTILQRAQLKGLVPTLVNALKSYLNNDPRNGIWLLNEFSNWEIIQEMLLQPLGQEMPKLCCGILYCAMLAVYPQEKSKLNCHWIELEQAKQQGQATEEVQTSVGTLGNFILMLITQIYDLKDYAMNQPHYFQILARFASLGAEAREFLLRARVVGRCMDMFFDSASPYRKEFADMRDLGALRACESPDIGLPTQNDRKQRDIFQQLQENRRRKQLAGAPLKHKYLIELVSYCVRHLKVGGRGGASGPTAYQLDADSSTLHTFVSTQESDIFIPEPKFLKRFFLEAKRVRSMQAVSKAYCHYAHFDAENINELFHTVNAGLFEQDFDGIRPFLCLLQEMLDNNHNNFVSRRDEWLTRFLDIVKNNQGYFKWMETIFEFIFKITTRIPRVRDWFYQNPDKWQFLIDWARQHQRPPHPAQGQVNGVRLYKQRLSSMNASQYQDNTSSMKNTASTGYRIRRLNDLVQKTLPDLRGEPDVDKLDMQDYKFVPGDILTMYHRKRDEGEQWRVVTVLDELISIQNLEPGGGLMGKQSPIWQKCDTDKIWLGDIWKNLARTVFRKEAIQKSIQMQNQRAEAAKNAAARAAQEADENAQGEWHGGGAGRSHYQGGQGVAQGINSSVPSSVPSQQPQEADQEVTDNEEYDDSSEGDAEGKTHPAGV